MSVEYDYKYCGNQMIQWFNIIAMLYFPTYVTSKVSYHLKGFIIQMQKTFNWTFMPFVPRKKVLLEDFSIYREAKWPWAE